MIEVIVVDDISFAGTVAAYQELGMNIIVLEMSDFQQLQPLPQIDLSVLQYQFPESEPPYIHTPSFGFLPLPAVRSFAEGLFPLARSAVT